MTTINRVYIVVNAAGDPYACDCVVGRTPAICIERAEYILDDLWKNLQAEGYRVAVANLTIQRVMSDEETRR